MKGAHKVAPHSLRISEHLKGKAKDEAAAHRRSLNTEIELLIEEGLKWREMQESKKAVA